MKNNKNFFWSSLILSIVLVFGIGFFINTNASPTPIYYNLIISEANTTTEVTCGGVPVETGEGKIVEGSFLTVNVFAEDGYTVDFLIINGETFTNGGTFAVQTDIEIVSSASVNTYDLTFFDHVWEKPTYSILCNNETIDFGTDVIKYGDILNITANFDSTLLEIDYLYLTNGSLLSSNFVGNAIEIVVDGDVQIFAKLIAKSFDFNIVSNNSTVSIVETDDEMLFNRTHGRFGWSYTILATPNENYKITNITLNGEILTSNIFLCPASDVEIVVSTSLNSYSVSIVNSKNAKFEIKQGSTTILTSYSPSMLFFNCLIFGETYTFLATANENSNLITCQLNFEDFTSGDNFTCNGDLTINLIAESTNVPDPTFSLTVDLTCSYANFYYSIDNGETFINVNSTNTLILPNIPVSTFLFYAVADFGIAQNVDFHYSCMGGNQVDFGGNNEVLTAVEIDLTNVLYMSISIASWE